MVLGEAPGSTCSKSTSARGVAGLTSRGDNRYGATATPTTACASKTRARSPPRDAARARRRGRARPERLTTEPARTSTVLNAALNAGAKLALARRRSASRCRHEVAYRAPAGASVRRGSPRALCAIDRPPPATINLDEPSPGATSTTRPTPRERDCAWLSATAAASLEEQRARRRAPLLVIRV